MPTGKIARWNDDRGFGFIQNEDGSEIFAHIRDVKGHLDALAPGQRVKFDEGFDRRSGKPHAQRVELI